jgi:polysaccharide biosynthesis/export protein
MRKLLLRSLLSVVAVPALIASVNAQSPAPTAEQVTLAPGDSLRIVVWRKPEMSGDFIVAPDGTISHPLYRAVRVGGVPFSTAEVNLRNFLARFEQDPQFVAEPLILVAISGEVGKPQVFGVRPETTIAQAVAQAGGPKETAKRQVTVLRREANGRQREFQVDLFNPDVSGNVRVHSGDQIVLDRRKSFFRDFFIPALGVIGSVASIGLLIDRATRN